MQPAHDETYAAPPPGHTPAGVPGATAPPPGGGVAPAPQQPHVPGQAVPHVAPPTHPVAVPNVQAPAPAAPPAPPAAMAVPAVPMQPMSPPPPAPAQFAPVVQQAATPAPAPVAPVVPQQPPPQAQQPPPQVQQPATPAAPKAPGTRGYVPKGTIAAQLAGKRLRIGEALIEMGLLEPGQLEHALDVQRRTGQRIGRVLVAEGLVGPDDIAKALARRLAIEYVDLHEIEISDEIAQLIPGDACNRYDCVAIGEASGALVVAMADPTNMFAIDDLRLVTGKEIRVVAASPQAIDMVLSNLISLDEQVSEAVDIADDWEEELVPLEDISDSDSESPAIRLVNQIITQAVLNGVSDLHFEPRAEDMIVRFRKDGVLMQATLVPIKLRAGVTSRLKIMANLDIAEKRKPQDGRIGLIVSEKAIDLRVATLPTVYGEKVVLRVLDRSSIMLTMDQLGFYPEPYRRLRSVYSQPYGCLLVTGPTGSGKSTTLYAALNEVNDVQKNIITVEDPVEYRLAGVNQVQTNPKAGLTFSSALRSILRSDPDIVMIGEMRDGETAKIGIEAALTGHLVLSTLHTNTAPGAITRLIEMDVEPYLIGSSVLGVLAQRLARRLCKCKEAFEPTPDWLAMQGFPAELIEQGVPVLYRPKGCHRCGGAGYRGRTGIHEVMLMSEEIEQLTIKRASADEISRVAQREGMDTMFLDGVRKVIDGHTTMDELRRIVQT